MNYRPGARRDAERQGRSSIRLSKSRLMIHIEQLLDVSKE
jgi:hypothetical protein